ncbi:hypothetical protein QTO34_014547 [Cnephaeus nilssonii]|uniref:UAP56-interacting factor n=1 Tax=Cnephaeus nilssonii TaxID=3371016 RepID=A0AA40I6S8_CNENI|nr:hypothetical protein QTO34_014547 [Eptesicus nilssonii]
MGRDPLLCPLQPRSPPDTISKTLYRYYAGYYSKDIFPKIRIKIKNAQYHNGGAHSHNMAAPSPLSPAGVAGGPGRSVRLPPEFPSPLSPPATQGQPEAQASLGWRLPSRPGPAEACTAGSGSSRGFGKNNLSRRGRIMPGKRRSYGVITGLAARKTTGIRKGISPMNRPPLSDKNIERYFPALKRKANLLRQNEVQRKPVAVLKRPNQLNRKNNIPTNYPRSVNKLSHQKDTRQATFLFRRGLKVQAQLNTEQLLDDVVAKRTRQTQKPQLTRTAVPSFLAKREQSDVKKVPKGVPLQFDINSVGKQTGMTLNERFGILKEQRSTLTFNKGGSRFVTTNILEKVNVSNLYKKAATVKTINNLTTGRYDTHCGQ